MTDLNIFEQGQQQTARVQQEAAAKRILEEGAAATYVAEAYKKAHPERFKPMSAAAWRMLVYIVFALVVIGMVAEFTQSRTFESALNRVTASFDKTQFAVLENSGVFVGNVVLIRDFRGQFDAEHLVLLPAGTELQYENLVGSAGGIPASHLRMKESDCKRQNLNCDKYVVIPNDLWKWKISKFWRMWRSLPTWGDTV